MGVLGIAVLAFGPDGNRSRTAFGLRSEMLTHYMHVCGGA